MLGIKSSIRCALCLWGTQVEVQEGLSWEKTVLSLSLFRIVLNMVKVRSRSILVGFIIIIIELSTDNAIPPYAYIFGRTLLLVMYTYTHKDREIYQFVDMGNEQVIYSTMFMVHLSHVHIPLRNSDRMLSKVHAFKQ